MACLIVDSGRIVRDEPMPVRSLVEGNASYHLDMHLEQLNALCDDLPTRPRTAEPPTEFDAYEFVLLTWPDGRPSARRGAGRTVAGPAPRAPGSHERGRVLEGGRALRRTARRALAGHGPIPGGLARRGPAPSRIGPGRASGPLEVEVMAWFTEKGALSFPGSFGPGPISA